MIRFRLFFLFGLMFSLVSCVPTKMRTSSVKPSEIKDLAYFEPEAYINLIKKGNQGEYNDSLSMVAHENLTKTIDLYKPRYPITEKIEIENDSLRYLVSKEISYLMNTAMQTRRLKRIKLTPKIDSILDARQQRFALALVATGFGRIRGNYGKQVAKGVGVGILTLGMFYTVPVKSNLTIIGIIFDAENDEVIFFNKTKPMEKNPTEILPMKRQFWHLFNGYFWERFQYS